MLSTALSERMLILTQLKATAGYAPKNRICGGGCPCWQQAVATDYIRYRCAHCSQLVCQLRKTTENDFSETIDGIPHREHRTERLKLGVFELWCDGASRCGNLEYNEHDSHSLSWKLAEDHVEHILDRQEDRAAKQRPQAAESYRAQSSGG